MLVANHSPKLLAKKLRTIMIVRVRKR